MSCSVSPSILHAILWQMTGALPTCAAETFLLFSIMAAIAWSTTDTRQAVTVNAKAPLKSTSLNWDMPSPGAGPAKAPILTPRDVIQVAFLLDEQPGVEEAHDDPSSTAADDSKRVLGQLAIQWRSALGDRGSLSTGWLTSRR